MGPAIMVSRDVQTQALPDQCGMRPQALQRSGWLAWPALLAPFLQLLKTTQTKEGKAARSGTQAVKHSADACVIYSLRFK